MGVARLARPDACLAMRGRGSRAPRAVPISRGSCATRRSTAGSRSRSPPTTTTSKSAISARECPIENAISLEPSGAAGETRFRPVVHDACVGCGTCEMMCPAEPAAIVVDTGSALGREA
ncbi:MAG: 4Fe-4S binding protein [Paracoccaceae bacterium]